MTQTEGWFYAKDVTSPTFEPKATKAEAMKKAAQNLADRGTPINTGAVIGELARFGQWKPGHGEVQQILYWLGYRAVESTVKAYGRGWSFNWAKPKEDVKVSPLGTAYSAETKLSDEAWKRLVSSKTANPAREIDTNNLPSHITVWELRGVLEAIGLSIRIEVFES